MSAEAYREVYGQEPPAGAHFGADISWYQGAWGESLDSGTLHATWAGLVQWAEWVTIRCSYGNNSEDGAQNAHVQYADIHGYPGKLGGYHFYYSGDPARQAQNYLNHSASIRDRLTHHMVDAEASPAAPIWQLNEWCDRVEQATGQPAIIYSGWSYLNQAGATNRKLWIPHYASRRYNAWNGTPGSWDTWNAPYTPDWYGQRNPTIWQFTSNTANHGSLDLNVCTNDGAEFLGLGQIQGDDFLSALSSDEQRQLFDRVAWLQQFVGFISAATDHTKAQADKIVWNLGQLEVTQENEAKTVASRTAWLQQFVSFISAATDHTKAQADKLVWNAGQLEVTKENESKTLSSMLHQLIDRPTVSAEALRTALTDVLKDLPHIDADLIATKVVQTLSDRLTS